MNGQICRVSGALATIGVGKGNRVAVRSPHPSEGARLL